MKNGIDFALALAVGSFTFGPTVSAQTLNTNRGLSVQAQSESAAASQNPPSELADSFRRQAKLVGMAPARATIKIGPRRIKLEVGMEIPFTLDRQKRMLRLDSMNTDDPSHPIATFHYQEQVIELAMDMGGEEPSGDDTRPASYGTGPIHLDASNPSFPTSLLAPNLDKPVTNRPKKKRKASAKSAPSSVIFGNKKPSAKAAKKNAEGQTSSDPPPKANSSSAARGATRPAKKAKNG